MSADGSKPVLLTASGTGADMWTGYPADIAHAVEDLWYFQPINYRAAMFPMGKSVDEGVDEGVRIVNEEIPVGTPTALCGYSQGGMLVSRLLDEYRSGRLKHRQSELVAGLTLGNPDRELDASGGRGISNSRIKNTPPWWIDLFDRMDIYGNVPNNDVGEDMTAIFRFVQLRDIDDLIGEDSIGEQIIELITSFATGGGLFGSGLALLEQLLGAPGFLPKIGVTGPLSGFPAAVMAIIKGIAFFGAKPATAPHIEYHIREISPGVTYFDQGVAHLRDAGVRAHARMNAA
ncbi:PE-PPE domain-containing protein [Mycobacteroides abscessus]|uniref:PE-PPE domain-containing protein n=1 Tax=Mycobacteroides abscessus TaxID=36809 RepID=UPI001C65A3AC|nr:PE-PPE domain-containing protein [Mycobacteroides abscessus]